MVSDLSEEKQTRTKKMLSEEEGTRVSQKTMNYWQAKKRLQKVNDRVVTAFRSLKRKTKEGKSAEFINRQANDLRCKVMIRKNLKGQTNRWLG